MASRAAHYRLLLSSEAREWLTVLVDLLYTSKIVSLHFSGQLIFTP